MTIIDSNLLLFRNKQDNELEIIDFGLLVIRIRSRLNAFDRWLFRSNGSLKALEEQTAFLDPFFLASDVHTSSKSRPGVISIL
jgi:hypothetical protein